MNCEICSSIIDSMDSREKNNVSSISRMRLKVEISEFSIETSNQKEIMNSIRA